MKFRKLITFATLSFCLGLTHLQAQSGKSLKFNGKDQYMSIPHHDDFNIAKTESFTITAQIKVRKWQSWSRFICKRAFNSPIKSGYELAGASSSVEFLACNTPNNVGKGEHTNSLSKWTGVGANLNEWVHIALVVDRTEGKMSLYQGGVKRQDSSGKDIAPWECNNKVDVIIGAMANLGSTPNNYFFNGEIDNLRFWKRALSANEIMLDKASETPDENKLVAAYDFENIDGLTVPDISNSTTKHDAILANYPAEVGTFVVEQVKSKTGRSNTEEAILKLKLNLGNTQEERAKLKSLKLKMDGTTAINDVKAIKVLLKNDNSQETKVVGTASPKEGVIELTLNELELGTRESQIIIAYDVADNAREGNKLDAKLLELKLSKQTLNLESKGNPDGNREIMLVRKRIFAPGDYGSKNYRIPAIITAKDGSLVALTDKRKNNESDLPEDIDVVVRRSTDMGLTWSEPLTIAKGEGYGKGYGDPAIVMAKDGTLITTFVGGPGLWDGTTYNPQRTYISKSKDNGQTWSPAKDITNQLYGANCSNDEFKRFNSSFCASGNGLCTRNGRIMFVAGLPVSRGHIDNYIFYSDDNGDNWNVSSLIKRGGDEAKVVELNNGDLLVSVRHGGYGTGTKPRPWVRSTDGGKTWTESGSWTDVKDPACNGDIIYYTSKTEGYDKNRLLHSIPYNENGKREDVSVLLSYDEGASWSIKRQISEGSSAYSSLCKLKDGTIGIYVEETDPTTAKGYSLYFLRFSLKWLTGGTDEYKTPNITAIESLSEKEIRAFFVNGKLQIEGLKNSAEVKVYNISSQLLESFEVKGNIHSKALKLNKGFYIIAIKQADKTLSYKLYF